MAQIVSLSEYREQSLVQAGFRFWHRCFEDTFDARTRLNDLSPPVLCALAQPADQSADYYYALILGLLGHGDADDFKDLDNQDQMRVVDIHLFLADQVRFEMMRRLGWLSRYSATQYQLVDMVLRFEQIRNLFHQDPPVLAATHPEYAKYQTLIAQDQQVFIRRLLPSALDEFKRINTC